MLTFKGFLAESEAVFFIENDKVWQRYHLDENYDI